MTNRPAETIDELECLVLEVITSCNLRCKDCFALAELPEKSSMPFETAKAIAREGREAGFPILSLSGGEPMLWRRLFELIEYALDLGYHRVKFNTNGTRLNDENCERLAAFGERVNLSISLNGSRELHDRIRGQGTFDDTVAAIENALKHGLRLEIFAVVGRSLLEELPDFARFLRDTFPDIMRLRLIQLHRTVGSADLPEELLRPEDLVQLAIMASLLNVNALPVAFLDNPLAVLAAAKSGMPRLPPSGDRRRFGQVSVHRALAITGSHSIRDAYGQYTPGALLKLVRSPEYRAAVAPDEAICGPCEFRGDCRAHGLLRPITNLYDQDDDTPYCKRVNRALRREEQNREQRKKEKIEEQIEGKIEGRHAART